MKVNLEFEPESYCEFFIVSNVTNASLVKQIPSFLSIVSFHMNQQSTRVKCPEI